MDEFSLEWPELHGGAMHLEFGETGRISQMWVLDMDAPDGEEIEFVAPRIQMGEEATEDFFPGTILISARTDPEDPWIGSRNQSAERLEHEQEGVAFDYEFPFIDDLRVVGTYRYEAEPVPHVTWDLELRNRSRRSVEIGELGFPMAFNNVLEVNGRDAKAIEDLYEHRVHLHMNVGRAGSYLHAARVSGEGVGILVMPGKDTEWEFANSVPASLHSPYRWPGIPIAYVHSRATIDREEWPEWFNGHSSFVLEPGDVRKVQLIFAPVGRPAEEELHKVIAQLGKPAVRIFPGAVIPVDIPIGIEIAGPTPTEFHSVPELELETDADENGGFCLAKPVAPGPFTVEWTDVLGQTTDLHLLAISPINELLQRRATFITAKQTVTEGMYAGAITGCDNRPEPDDPDWLLAQPFGVEFGLADALFLAAKNIRIPNQDEITGLAAYAKFLRRHVVHPVTHDIGTDLGEKRSPAIRRYAALPYLFAHAFFARMDRLTEIDATDDGGYGETAAAILEAFYQLPDYYRMHASGHYAFLLLKDGEFSLDSAPTMPEWSADFWAERAERDYRWHEFLRAEQNRRVLFAGRSSAPHWWTFGSDLRFSHPKAPHPALTDTASMSHGPSAPAALYALRELLDKEPQGDYESAIRTAVGGYLAPFAYIRDDGAASMGYTADPASTQYGMSTTGGDLGVALTLSLEAGATGGYLRGNSTGFTIGCQIENDETTFRLRPYDAAQSVRVPALGFLVTTTAGIIEYAEIQADLRRAVVHLANLGNQPLRASVSLSGMWGKSGQLTVGEASPAPTADLAAPFEVMLAEGSVVKIEVSVEEPND